MKYLVRVLALVLLITISGAFGMYLVSDKSPSNDPGANTSVSDQVSSNAKVLDLSNTGLAKVTADVYGKTETTDLILSNNAIKTLPSEMGKMVNVTVFKIDHNILEGSLIGEIRQMSKLTTLDVSYNKMTGMPAEIGQLSNLVRLDYSYNNIDGLPNELGNLKMTLKELNLTGNPLSDETLTRLRTQLPDTNIIF